MHPVEKTNTRSSVLRTLAACGTPADKRNNLILFWMTLAWAVGLTVSAQTLKGRIFSVEAGTLAAWFMAFLPVVLFIPLLHAYIRLLRGTDELQRLIQLQSLAVGFGASVLLLMHWELFEFVGMPAMDPSDAVMAPIVAWVLSQLYLGWRYR